MRLLSRVTLAALALVALSDPLWAERIGVRSGEHDGFTRLVFDLPRALPWTLITDGAEARLTLKGVRPEYDLSDAFRRLTTDRIVGLTPVQGENALTIALGCDCRVEAFRAGANMLAIDIHGDPETLPKPPKNTLPDTPLATAEIDTSEPTPAPPTKPTRYSYVFPFEPQTHHLPVSLAFGRLKAPNAPAIAMRQPEPDSPAATGPDMAELKRKKRLLNAELRLTEQLSRAAAQGLVTPRTAQLPDQHTTSITHTGQSLHPGAHEPPATTKTPGQPDLNLRAQTSADRDFVRLLDSMAPTASGSACLTDSDLDITAWAGTGHFGDQVGQLRSDLVGEFDRPNPQTARALAKLYIHYGFGAEALLVLRMAELTGEGTNLLKAMAEIMEYGHSTGPAPFSFQFDCDSAAALWAVLAHENLPAGAHPNSKAILRSLDALPPPLRSFLGPTVSDRLVAAGKPEVAADVLRLVERGSDTPDTRFDMAEARLQLAEGEGVEATRTLDRVVDANVEMSPEALIALIDERLTAGELIDIQTAGLAGAYAHEYRKETLGAELKRVHILALSEAGAYDEAFHELSLFSVHATPEVAADLRSHAMAALARDGGDTPFLKYALDTNRPDATALSPKSGNAVAERLIALGFPARAEAYLQADGDGDGVHERQRRLLKARAALAQSKPQRAEADLLGLKGPEADLMRAEARAMSGDHEAARRLFGALDRPDEMLAEAWLASDWAALQQSGDPFWAETAEMVADPAPGDLPATEAVLARDRALIEDSATSRGTIAQLLARTAVDEDTDSGSDR